MTTYRLARPALALLFATTAIPALAEQQRGDPDAPVVRLEVPKVILPPGVEKLGPGSGTAEAAMVGQVYRVERFDDAGGPGSGLEALTYFRGRYGAASEPTE